MSDNPPRSVPWCNYCSWNHVQRKNNMSVNLDQNLEICCKSLKKNYQANQIIPEWGPEKNCPKLSVINRSNELSGKKKTREITS